MPVYFDHNATTPLDPAVVEAMMPYMTGIYGNPSSVHRYGRIARNALDQARAQVASLVGAQANQVFFTSGGTESNNLAIKGGLANLPVSRFAISEIEHASVLKPASSMSDWQLDMIPVNTQGQVDMDNLQSNLHDDTQLVSIMSANNETGVLQDLQSLVEAVKKFNTGIVFHSDACQMAGKVEMDFAELNLDLMSLSSHKLYGPQGAGALIVNRSVDLAPQIEGGGQEKGLRSGTENLAAIVGFGMAAELAANQLQQRQEHTSSLQGQLLEQLKSMTGVEVFSNDVPRLPNTVQFSVAGIDGETLLMELDRKGFAVSSGSACDSSHTEPSHVLLAMSVPAETARGAIRVSFGEQNSAQNVSGFIQALNSIRQQYTLDSYIQA